MTGRLLIDGTDVYSRFGVFAIKDGWNELVAWAPLKTPKTYEFPEEDGAEVDLTAPRLDTREVSVKFAIRGFDADFFGFVALLSDGAYHTFNIASIGRTYRLRLVSHGTQDLLPLLGFVTFKFADDFPADKLTDNTPLSNLAPRRDFKIGDYDENGSPINYRPLSNYGARVLEGAYSQITKIPPVRKNLTVTGTTIQGAQYDPKMVVYQVKEVVLSVLFRADTLAELWNNYDALLRDLIQPEERALAVWLKDIDQTFPCYYKKCSVKEFFPEGTIWLRADITFVLTRDFRIVQDEELLSSEEDVLIGTEEATSRAIRIRPAKRYAYLVTDDSGMYMVDEMNNKIIIFI